MKPRLLALLLRLPWRRRPLELHEEVVASLYLRQGRLVFRKVKEKG